MDEPVRGLGLDEASGIGSASETGPPALAPDGRRGAGSALAEVFLCSGFPTQFVLALLLGAAGFAATVEGELSLFYVVTLSFVDSILIAGLVVCFLHARRESVRDLLLGDRPARPEVVLGLCLTPLLLLGATGGVLLLRWLAPSLNNVPDNPFAALVDTPVRAALFAVVAVVAGGLREELQRAFILRRFEQHLGGGWLGLIVFSTAFGIGHVVQGWDTAILTGSLGIVWGALYLTRRSAVASIVSHAGFNLTQIGLALLSGA